MTADQTEPLRRTTNYGVLLNLTTEPVSVRLAWNYNTLDHNLEPMVIHLTRFDIHNKEFLEPGHIDFEDDYLPDDFLGAQSNSEPIIHNIQTLMSVCQSSYCIIKSKAQPEKSPGNSTNFSTELR